MKWAIWSCITAGSGLILVFIDICVLIILQQTPELDALVDKNEDLKGILSLMILMVPAWFILGFIFSIVGLCTPKTHIPLSIVGMLLNIVFMLGVILIMILSRG